jgi:hypothetical protein
MSRAWKRSSNSSSAWTGKAEGVDGALGADGAGRAGRARGPGRAADTSVTEDALPRVRVSCGEVAEVADVASRERVTGLCSTPCMRARLPDIGVFGEIAETNPTPPPEPSMPLCGGVPVWMEMDGMGALRYV